jgi:hypothetical protein
LHGVAESARGGVDQFRWVDKVRRTAWVNVNGCSQLSKAPGSACVIEMNVTEKNVAYMLRREPCIAKIDDDIVERGFRAGIENRDAFIRL